jgi:hypothetical protein
MTPGQKVVCVDDSPCGYCGDSMGLIKGQVYVVSSSDTHENGRPVVRLIGWQTACAKNHLEPAHWAGAHRFRLLSDLKHLASIRQHKIEKKDISGKSWNGD